MVYMRSPFFFYLFYLLYLLLYLGSYISFPTFGSEKSQIQVYAENNINVERTLRSLNYLVITKKIVKIFLDIDTLF